MAKKTSKKNILKNLTIKNFRCFENFHLKDLKRVNIFVGDNNSGKSSVLEAVGFFISNGEKLCRYCSIKRIDNL